MLKVKMNRVVIAADGMQRTRSVFDRVNAVNPSYARVESVVGRYGLAIIGEADERLLMSCCFELTT